MSTCNRYEDKIDEARGMYSESRVERIGAVLNHVAQSMGLRTCIFDHQAVNDGHKPAVVAAKETLSVEIKLDNLTPGEYVIGRYASSDFCFEDRLVSRQHCCLTVHTNGEMTLRDMSSGNGTWVEKYVDGTLVSKKRIIKASIERGDKIRLAGCGPSLTVL